MTFCRPFVCGRGIEFGSVCCFSLPCMWSSDFLYYYMFFRTYGIVVLLEEFCYFEFDYWAEYDQLWWDRVKGAVELEEEMLAKLPKFKARPLPKKVPALVPLSFAQISIRGLFQKFLERATKRRWKQKSCWKRPAKSYTETTAIECRYWRLQRFPWSQNQHPNFQNSRLATVSWTINQGRVESPCFWTALNMKLFQRRGFDLALNAGVPPSNHGTCPTKSSKYSVRVHFCGITGWPGTDVISNNMP